MDGGPEKPPKHESFQSFDILASVDMYSFDLMMYGQVLPETKARVFDEELTYIAEGINRPLTTQFVLREQAGQLVYFDRGQWRPYMGTLITGLEVAKREAANDSRKQFLVERAETDLSQGYQFMNLAPGESVAWYSAYPEQEERLYGTDFIKQQGFQPARKMGFLYHATRRADGSLVLTTQSVDNSSEQAFQAAMQQTGGMNTMRAAYDATMSYLHHDSFYAGRRGTIDTQNAWETLQGHRDLLNYYFDQIEELARSNEARTDLRRSKQELTYGVWAALKERIDRVYTKLDFSSSYVPGSGVEAEVMMAYQTLRQRGEELIGCGGRLLAERLEALLDSPEAVFDLIFGQPESRQSWNWKTGVCRVEVCATRPGKTEVGPCDVCRKCQAEFDKGRDPTKKRRPAVTNNLKSRKPALWMSSR